MAKKIVLRTLNNAGDKAKTYVMDCKNTIIFHKFTLHKKGEGEELFESMLGGETIIKETKRYSLTFHRFSIKKSTLLTALTTFELI